MSLRRTCIGNNEMITIVSVNISNKGSLLFGKCYSIHTPTDLDNKYPQINYIYIYLLYSLEMHFLSKQIVQENFFFKEIMSEVR